MIEGCTALILAGGDSSRMGQDKAGLLAAGETLLARVTASMQTWFPKLIVSVRQPRAEVVLQQVCDAHADGGSLAGLVAMVGGHPQPLFAFYAQHALTVMRNALESGEKRVRAVLKQLDVRYVEEAELCEFDPQFRSFIDLDTPQDYAAVPVR